MQSTASDPAKWLKLPDELHSYQSHAARFLPNPEPSGNGVEYKTMGYPSAAPQELVVGLLDVIEFPP